MKNPRHAIGTIIMVLLTNSCSPYVAIPEDSKGLHAGFTKVADQTSHGNRVLIHSFGSTPIELQKNIMQIGGYRLSVYQSYRNEEVFCQSGGEIDGEFIIDLTDFTAGVIRITTTTQDPRWPEKDHIPFVEKTVTILPQGRTSISHRLILEPEHPDPKRIDQLFSEIISLSKSAHDDDAASTAVWRNLTHIRNMSSQDPDSILRRLRSMPPLPGDCSCGHLIIGIIDEVEQIQMAQQTTTNAAN